MGDSKIGVMRAALLLLVLVACHRPLRPGESRCYTSSTGSQTSYTHCKAGPPAAPDAGTDR